MIIAHTWLILVINIGSEAKHKPFLYPVVTTGIINDQSQLGE